MEESLSTEFSPRHRSTGSRSKCGAPSARLRSVETLCIDDPATLTGPWGKDGVQGSDHFAICFCASRKTGFNRFSLSFSQVGGFAPLNAGSRVNSGSDKAPSLS